MKGTKFETRFKIYSTSGDIEKGTRLVSIGDEDSDRVTVVKEEDYVVDPFNILGVKEYLHQNKDVFVIYKEYLKPVEKFDKAKCDWRYRAACAADGDCADFCDMECPYKKE